jgi:hypothetical protein
VEDKTNPITGRRAGILRTTVPDDFGHSARGLTLLSAHGPRRHGGGLGDPLIYNFIPAWPTSRCLLRSRPIREAPCAYASSDAPLSPTINAFINDEILTALDTYRSKDDVIGNVNGSPNRGDLCRPLSQVGSFVDPTNIAKLNRHSRIDGEHPNDTCGDAGRGWTDRSNQEAGNRV